MLTNDEKFALERGEIPEALEDAVLEILWEDCFRGTPQEYGAPRLFQRLQDPRNGPSMEDLLRPVKEAPKMDWNLGAGTYKWNYSEEVIQKHLEMGCDFIDTAPTYGYGRVEKALGPILLHNNFKGTVATKFSKAHMRSTSVINSLWRSKKVFREQRLHFQLHWPNVKFSIIEALHAMEQLRVRGQVSSLGVCNMTTDMLANARRTAAISSIQIPYNPTFRWAEKRLIPFCKKNQIVVIAYSPLKTTKMLDGPLEEIAKAAGVSRAMLILNWERSKGVFPIPKTNHVKHAEENAQIVLLGNKIIKQVDEATNKGG